VLRSSLCLQYRNCSCRSSLKHVLHSYLTTIKPSHAPQRSALLVFAHFGSKLEISSPAKMLQEESYVFAATFRYALAPLMLLLGVASLLSGILYILKLRQHQRKAEEVSLVSPCTSVHRHALLSCPDVAVRKSRELLTCKANSSSVSFGVCVLRYES
jgi:hypothetical protein